MRVCRGASCRQLGAGTAADAEAADCLFICGVGPVVEVDGVLHGRAAPALPDLPRHALVQDGTCSRAVAQIPHTATRVGCAGNCFQAPAWSLDQGATWTSADGAVWRRPGEVRLLANVGRIDPLAGRAYDALERALRLGSDAVWELVKASGLRGRGGAYFPVGAKWETARNTPHARKKCYWSMPRKASRASTRTATCSKAIRIASSKAC